MGIMSDLNEKYSLTGEVKPPTISPTETSIETPTPEDKGVLSKIEQGRTYAKVSGSERFTGILQRASQFAIKPAELVKDVLMQDTLSTEELKERFPFAETRPEYRSGTPGGKSPLKAWTDKVLAPSSEPREDWGMFDEMKLRVASLLDADWQERAKFKGGDEAIAAMEQNADILEAGGFENKLLALANSASTQMPRMLITMVSPIHAVGFFQLEVEEQGNIIDEYAKAQKVEVNEDLRQGVQATFGMISGGLEYSENLLGIAQLKNTIGKKLLTKEGLMKVALGNRSGRVGLFLGSQLFASIMEGMEEVGQEEIKLLGLNYYIWQENRARAEAGQTALPYITFKEIQQKGWGAFGGGFTGGLTGMGVGAVSATAQEVKLTQRDLARKQVQDIRVQIFQKEERVRYSMEEGNKEADAEIRGDREATLKEIANTEGLAPLFRKLQEVKETNLARRPGAAVIELEDVEGDTTEEKLINAILANTYDDDAWIARKDQLLHKRLEEDTELSSSDKFFARLLYGHNDISLGRVFQFKNLVEAIVENFKQPNGEPDFASIDEFVDTMMTERAQAEGVINFLQGQQNKYEIGTTAFALFDVILTKRATSTIPYTDKELFDLVNPGAETPKQAVQQAVFESSEGLKKAMLADLKKNNVNITRESLDIIKNILSNSTDINYDLVKHLFDGDYIYKLLSEAGGKIDLTKEDMTDQEELAVRAFLELSSNLLYAALSDNNFKRSNTGDKAIGTLAGLFGTNIISSINDIMDSQNLPILGPAMTVKNALFEIVNETQKEIARESKRGRKGKVALKADTKTAVNLKGILNLAYRKSVGDVDASTLLELTQDRNEQSLARLEELQKEMEAIPEEKRTEQDKQALEDAIRLQPGLKARRDALEQLSPEDIIMPEERGTRLLEKLEYLERRLAQAEGALLEFRQPAGIPIDPIVEVKKVAKGGDNWYISILAIVEDLKNKKVTYPFSIQLDVQTTDLNVQQIKSIEDINEVLKALKQIRLLDTNSNDTTYKIIEKLKAQKIKLSLTSKKEQAQLTESYRKAAQNVLERVFYGTRKETAGDNSYLASWSNTSKTWSYFKVNKGEVTLDANEIIFTATSKDHALVIAEALPVLPLFKNSTEARQEGNKNAHISWLGTQLPKNSKAYEELVKIFGENSVLGESPPELVSYVSEFFNSLENTQAEVTKDKKKQLGFFQPNEEYDKEIEDRVRAARGKLTTRLKSPFSELGIVKNPFKQGTLEHALIQHTFSREFDRLVKYGRLRVEDIDYDEPEEVGSHYSLLTKTINVEHEPALPMETTLQIADHESQHAVQHRVARYIRAALIKRKVTGQQLLDLMDLSIKYYKGDVARYNGVDTLRQFLKQRKNQVITQQDLERQFGVLASGRGLDAMFYLNRYLGELMSMYAAGQYNNINLVTKHTETKREELTKEATKDIGSFFEKLLGEDFIKAMDMIQKTHQSRVRVTPQAIKATQEQLRINREYTEFYDHLLRKYNPSAPVIEPKKFPHIRDVITIEGFEPLPPSVYRQLTHAERVKYDKLLFNATNKYRETKTFLHKAHITFYQTGPRLKSGNRTAYGVTRFYEDGKAMIEFFKNANLSTVAHEFMHVLSRHLDAATIDNLMNQYLSEEALYGVDDTSTKRLAKTQLQETWDIWMENPQDPRLLGGVHYHNINTYMEYITSQFEKYLFEGVAPTKALRLPFAIVKDDMRNIYATVNKIPGIRKTLNPHVSLIFDKLLAGSQFIRKPIPKTVKLGGTEYTLFVDSGAQKEINLLLKKLSEGYMDLQGIHKDLWTYAENVLKPTTKEDLAFGKPRDIPELQRLIGAVNSYKSAQEAIAAIDRIKLRRDRKVHNRLINDIKKVLKSVDWKKSDKRFVLRLQNELEDIDFKLMTPKKLAELTALKQWMHGELKAMEQTGELPKDLRDIALSKLKQLDRLSQTNIHDMNILELEALLADISMLVKVEGKKQVLRIKNRLMIIQNDVEALDKHLKKLKHKEKYLNPRYKYKESFGKLLGKATQRGTQPHRLIHEFADFETDHPLMTMLTLLREGEQEEYGRNTSDDIWFRLLMKQVSNPKTWSRIFNNGELESKDIFEYDVVDSRGEKRILQLSRGQRMALYIYAQNDNALRHLLGEGIMLPEHRDIGLALKLTPNQLNSIIGDMSEDEIALAEQIKDYYKNVVAPAINKISRVLVGYDIATEDNYLPLFIHAGKNSDYELLNKAAISGNMTQFHKQLIQRLSFLLDRKKSEAPIIMYDIFEIAKRNLPEVNKYVAYALPLQYAKGIFNSNTASRYSTAFGPVKVKVIEEWLEDIEDPTRKTSEIGKAAKRLKRTNVLAQLGANLLVGGIQRLSLPLILPYGIKKRSLGKAILLNSTPSTGFGFTYHNSIEYMKTVIPALAKRFELGPNVDVQEAYIHSATRHSWLEPTSVLQEASDIHSFRDLGRLISRLSVTESMKFIKENDAWAISTIWDAVQIEGKDQGWDEETQKNKFLEILYNTQPNYEGLHLSEVMRTKNVWERILFSTYHTMFNQAWNEARYHIKRYEKDIREAKSNKEIAKLSLKLGLTELNIYIWTNLVVNVLREALMGDSEEPEEFITNVGLRSLNTDLAKIPYIGGLLAEGLTGILDKRSIYSVFDPPGVFAINYLFGIGDQIESTLDNLEEGEYALAAYHLLRVGTKFMAIGLGYSWDTIIAQVERYGKRIDYIGE